MSERIGRGIWMTTRKIRRARAILRDCPDHNVRAEGLACLRNAEPEYLANLIPMDHPDRTAAVFYLEQNS